MPPNSAPYPIFLRVTAPGPHSAAAPPPEQLLYHWTYGDLDFLYSEWREQTIRETAAILPRWQELPPETQRAIAAGVIQQCAFPAAALSALFAQAAQNGNAEPPETENLEESSL